MKRNSPGDYSKMLEYCKLRLQQGTKTKDLYNEVVGKFAYPSKLESFWTYLSKHRTYLEDGIKVDAPEVILAGTPDAPEKEISKEFSENKGVITTKSMDIKTLDDALKAANVDNTVWKVSKYVVNSWEVTSTKVTPPQTYTNFQVKVWLEAREEEAPNVLAEGLKSFEARLMDYRPQHITPPPVASVRDPHMLEISLYDHHFGKLAHAEETGCDYNLEIAEALFCHGAAELISKAENYNIEQIVFPVGQDFLHINSEANTTVAGTPQDVAAKNHRIIDSAGMALIRAIDYCLQVAPVKILWVPGNHDWETSFHITRHIAAWYRNNPHVEVDVNPGGRKYHQYGINLIGFTHGDKEPVNDLHNIMSVECKDIWAEIEHREWHIGHLHKKKETRLVTADTQSGGAVIRILPSLCGTDSWHYRKGYVKGIRAAEGYLWSPTDGYAAHFSANYHTLKERIAA